MQKKEPIEMKKLSQKTEIMMNVAETWIPKKNEKELVTNEFINFWIRLFNSDEGSDYADEFLKWFNEMS